MVVARASRLIATLIIGREGDRSVVVKKRILLGLFVVSLPTFAQTAQPAAEVSVAPALSAEPVADVVVEPAIRDGVVLGASFGVGVGSASGYPNDVLYDRNPDYYGSTPMLPGYGLTFTIMGALTPYLNVGVFGGFANFGNSDWKSSGGGGGLRIEAYPLMAVCPCVIPKTITSNVGVYAQFGVGAVSTEVLRPGKYETIGGVEGTLAAGAFYEVWLGRLFSLAPDLRYEVINSRTSDRNSLMAGVRLAFYPGN
jgi:hypothetical protein